MKGDSLALLDTSDSARRLATVELKRPVTWAGDLLLSLSLDTLTIVDPATGERTTQDVDLGLEEGSFFNTNFSSDGQVIEVQHVYGEGDSVTIDLRSGKRVKAAKGTGVVLTANGPVVMVDTGMTAFRVADVPIAGPDGAQVGVWPMLGSAMTASVKGQLLFTNGLALVAVAHEPSLLGKEVDRTGSLFRKFETQRGAAAGFFGLQLRSPALLAGAGHDVFAIDTDTGALFKVGL
jgi:hypothetical protein